MLVENLLKLIDSKINVLGPTNQECSSFTTFDESVAESVTFLTYKKYLHNVNALKTLKAGLVIVDEDVLNDIDESELPNSYCLVSVENARISFARLLNKIDFDNDFPRVGFSANIHHSAKVHPSAVIESRVSLGANSIVGAGAVIKSDSIIGRNVIIGENSVIGKDGFGYVTTENKSHIKFRHLGFVEIADDVEIGAQTVIDKGTLGATRIGIGTKIDNLVHIAHNVIVGDNCLVIANSTLCGSAIVGNNCVIAPNSVIREGVKIGNDSTIGLGSVVIHDVPPYKIYVGNPARELR